MTELEHTAAHLIATDEDGQTMAEYAVLLGLITVTIILILAALSDAIAEQIADITAIAF